MAKKIIIIILFLLVIGAGAGGTFYYYNQNKNQITANEQLAAQNAQVQSQLAAIGAMVEVYEVSKNVYSGNEILDSDLLAVSVPASILAESSITDKNLLLGKHYRVNLTPGTILSTDMLMVEEEEATPKFPIEVTLDSLPVSTVVGDYVDIRFLVANGEEYVVLPHKKIERIMNNATLTFHITEEEQALLISLMSDLGIYPTGCVAYVTKYLEPGNSNSVAFYPIQHDMENFVRFNPNIKDTTRCINETLRDHIDEVLIRYTDSCNQAQATAFISMIKTQLSGQFAAHQKWVSDNTDEQGNFTGVAGNNTSSSGDSGMSFDQQVGEAMDQLEQDLEAIQ